MKKVLALVLAVVLSLGALSVFAANPTKGAKADQLTSAMINKWENDFANATMHLDSAGRPYIDLEITIPDEQRGAIGYSGMTGWQVSSKSTIDSIKFFNSSNLTGTNAVNGEASEIASSNAADTARNGDDYIRVRWPIRTTTSTSDVKLKGSFTLKDDGGTKASKVEFAEKTVVISGANTEFFQEDSSGDTDDYDSVTIVQGQIVKYTEGGKISLETKNGYYWIQTRVSKNSRLNASFTTTVPTALEDAYPYVSLTYFAPRSLSLSNWKVFFTEYDLEDKAENFVYGYADGKLYNLPANSIGYDKDEECLVVTGTGTLPAFVLSSVDLGITGDGTTTSGTTTTPSGTTTIPNTGSSDMVSAAVVMAVVSLAAAGAVAFKKTSK